MELRDHVQSWNLNTKDPYLPISYEGQIIGFCKPNYAVRIIKLLNEEENSRKALYKACNDLVALQGGNSDEVKQYVKKYLSMAKRPTHGLGAIMALLKDRQRELDLSDQEFVKFCDSYKLSAQELKNICDDKEIKDQSLHAIARILGISFDDLLVIRYGFKHE